MPVEIASRLVVPDAQRIGVALSGGGDSVALLHLLRQAGRDVVAVTVDHALRPDSAAEAGRVAGWCAGWGVPHDVLRWDHCALPRRGNLMQAARRARAALIAQWARGHGIGAVALGHTADDQAETLLMGLSRAAGIDGLCGLRAGWQDNGVRWLRPMLHLGRAELRDWLAGQGLPWVDDPTNGDDRYLRARLRKAMAVLAPLGLTAARLADSAGHLAQARQALNAAVAAAVPGVMDEATGALRLDGTGLAALPDEVSRRMVQGAILWLTGAEHAPRADDLLRFRAAIAAGRDATLAGARLHRGWLSAEARVATVARWHLTGGPVTGGPELGEVRLLGAAGLRQCPDWRATGLPRAVLEVTPGLWQGDRLIAAPCAGFGTARATCAPTFRSWMLSH